MSQFQGLPKTPKAGNVPPSPSVAASGTRATPRAGGHAGMHGFAADAASNADPTAPSIRIADADIEYVRGKGGATHTYSQGKAPRCVVHNRL
jgi:hypothetical protein